MSRRFLAGAAWGCVVAGIGLGVVSQVAPPPVDPLAVMPERASSGQSSQADSTPKLAEPNPPQPGAATPKAPVTVAKPATNADGTPDNIAEKAPENAGDAAKGASAPDAGVNETPPQVTDSAPQPDAPAQTDAVAAILPGADSLAPVKPVQQGMAAAEPSAPVSGDATAALPEPDLMASVAVPAPVAEPGQAPQMAAKSDSVTETLAAQPALPAAPAADAAPVATDPPPLPPLTAQEEAMIAAANALENPPEGAQPAPMPEPGVMAEAAPATEPATEDVPEATSAEGAPAPDSATRPAPGFGVVAGVETDRLPRIGAEAAETVIIDDTAVAPADDTTLPPVERFAAAFENPASKPVFAILLQDLGGSDVDRAALAALPFPVSFVLDPTRADAAEAAAIYAAAGKEVVMLAAGLPAGAQASDIAVSFEAYAKKLPQAVAVLDVQSDGFQDNRAVAAQVLAEIGTQGRGVLSWDRGLNAASQIARREGLRNATVYRQLDAGEESIPTIRRFLDRAAFKAAQDGRVVVFGTSKANTIAALLEWAVEGRAASVALAPVTAALVAQ